MIIKSITKTTKANEVFSEILEMGGQSVQYFTYRPKVLKSQSILVLIHGISRNAEEMIAITKSLADDLGMVSLAPLFDETVCKDYQRLGRKGKGPRADFMLHQMVAQTMERYKLENSKLILIGNSGGAQFSHRFAFAYPEMIEKTILVAPGWYTFPKNLKFPIGLNRTALLPDLRFKIKRILQVPFKVLVGEQDVFINKSLNQSKQVSWQGKNRIVRGENWVKSMLSAAQRHNMDVDITFELISGGKHEFKQMVEETNILESIRSWLL